MNKKYDFTKNKTLELFKKANLIKLIIFTRSFLNIKFILMNY